MPKHFSRVLGAVLVASLAGCAVPSEGGFSSLSAVFAPLASEGGLAVAFELPLARSVQALPDTTESVTIKISGAGLRAPISKTISRSQFVNQRAEMRVDKLPPGEIRVDATVFDASGAQVTMGGATALIKPGELTKVALNLVVKGETGSATIAIDTTVVYDDPVVTIPNPVPSITPTSLNVTSVSRSYSTPQWKKAIDLLKDQDAAITATGRVGYAYNSYIYSYYDAAGLTLNTAFGALDPDSPELALVGKFVLSSGSPATTFLIGKSKTFKAPADGVLYVGINTWTNLSNYYFGGSYDVALNPAE